MKQEAFELHTLLRAAHIKGPYILVGHSVGGLVTRVYASQYSQEVAGIVLIDSLHEDTTLSVNGKLAHMRELAKPDPVPAAQTMKSAPPKPVTKEGLDQFQSNLNPTHRRSVRLSASCPHRCKQCGSGFCRNRRARAAEWSFWRRSCGTCMTPEPGRHTFWVTLPLVVLLPKGGYGRPPQGVDADEWKRFNEEKRQQKIDFTNLSHNSKLIFAENSGHHIQLDEPQVVIDAVRLIVEASRQHKALDGKKL